MDVKFEYKENDVEGLEILDVISDAKKFNKWIYDTINPYCKGKVLEIGSGIGNISSLFLENNQAIVLSDIRDIYLDRLKDRFTREKSLQEIIKLDFVAHDFSERYADYLDTFDTVFALNVVEHIEDDCLAIANCKLLLKKGGKLIILVPAYQSLYNSFDKELFHFRRYTKKSLQNVFQENDFSIIHSKYFNLAGILGWYISGKLQRNKTIPENQMKFFNQLVPVFKFVDRIIFNKVGLSVIVVGEKGN